MIQLLDQVAHKLIYVTCSMVKLPFTPTAAIPESETWALMLLGFAGIGMSLRRREKTQRVKLSYV